MRAFAEAHTDPEVVQQVVAQLPRGHIVRLLESVRDPAASSSRPGVTSIGFPVFKREKSAFFARLL
jgi:hypothetical protein